MLPFPDKTPAPSIKDYLLLCIPTMFDLIATTLMNVGLLYVAASGTLATSYGAMDTSSYACCWELCTIRCACSIYQT